jgi:hypothetical protein
MWQGGAMRMRSPAVLAAAAALAAGCGWVSRSVPIEAASVSTDGRVMEFGVATCDAELTAEFTEDSISVSVLVLARGGSDQGCSQEVGIELEDPLGERRLIDRFDFSEVAVVEDPSLPGAESGDAGA